MSKKPSPKANESQQYSLVAKQDLALRALAKAEAAAKVHSHKTEEILSELECDKLEARGGWVDFNQAFFDKIMGKGE